MAISRVGSNQAGAVGFSITVNNPAGVQAGDLLIVEGTLSRSGAAFANSSYTGWTILRDETQLVDGSMFTRIVYRFADGSGTDAPPTFSTAVSGNTIATVGVYRGVDQTSPFLAENFTVEGTSSVSLHTGPTLNNTDAGAWGVLFGAARGLVTPQSWTATSLPSRLQFGDSSGPNNNNALQLLADSNGPLATGNHTWTGTTSFATGNATMWAAFLRPAAAAGPSGTATGSWAFAGVASGKRAPKATAPGFWSFAGIASGKRTPKASTVGSWSFAGAASGKRTPKATATGSWTIAGIASGKRTPKATSAGSWSFTGAAAGRRQPRGSATGSWSFTGTATGPAPQPKTYYVAGSGGSDAGNGLSTGAAWATIAKVNSTTLSPGDTVLFQRGATFSSAALVIDDSGISTQRITVGAYGTGALPIFDGADTTIPIKATGNYVTIEDVQAQNGGVAFPNEYGIAVAGTDGIVRRCTATHNAFGIGVQDGAHRARITECNASFNDTVVVGAGNDDDYGGNGVAIGAADDCEVDHCILNENYGPSPDYGVDGSAVEVFGAINASIHHNISHNCPNFSELGSTRTNGVVFHHNVITSDDNAPLNATAFNLQGTGPYGPVANVTIRHNSVRMLDADFSTTFIVLGTNTHSTVSVHNNVVEVSYAGWTAGIKIDEGHNVWQANVPDMWSTANSGQGIAPTSVVANPLFVNPTAFDLHLQAGSPAIDRGFDYSYTTDFDDDTRVVGSAPDAGAFEVQSVVRAGSATGSWIFSGTAAGKRTPKATASGSWAFTGAAAGRKLQRGSAAGVWTFASDATGRALLPPTGFTVTPVSVSQLDLSWNSVSGATGYDIERDGAVIVTDHAGTTYSDTGLAEATAHTYRVRAAG